MTIAFVQHEEALACANRHRQAQAQLKRNLKAMGPHEAMLHLAEVVEVSDPPAEIAVVKVHKLLLCCPRIGEAKATRLMRRAEASESKRLVGLTPRQRAALGQELREVADGWTG